MGRFFSWSDPLALYDLHLVEGVAQITANVTLLVLPGRISGWKVQFEIQSSHLQSSTMVV